MGLPNLPNIEVWGNESPPIKLASCAYVTTPRSRICWIIADLVVFFVSGKEIPRVISLVGFGNLPERPINVRSSPRSVFLLLIKYPIVETKILVVSMANWPRSEGINAPRSS